MRRIYGKKILLYFLFSAFLAVVSFCFSGFYGEWGKEKYGISTEEFHHLLLSGEYGKNGQADLLEAIKNSSGSGLSGGRTRRSLASSLRWRIPPFKYFSFYDIFSFSIPGKTFLRDHIENFYKSIFSTSFLFIRAGPFFCVSFFLHIY